jgi:hypothetical protein
MKQIDGHQIFLLAQMIGEFAIDCQNDTKNGVVIDDVTDHARFRTIVESLKSRNLPVSLNNAETPRQMIFEATPRIITYDFLAPQLEILKESVFAELRTMLFFRMDDEYRQYFEMPTPFGQTVALRFPTASFDIEEAGKCLALARPTACVFHSMRVMEVGVKALAKELKIPYAPSWESTSIKLKQTSPQSTKASRRSGKR